MNILVVTDISIPAINRTIPVWGDIARAGHDIRFVHPRVTNRTALAFKPHAIISMGVGVMNETFATLDKRPAKLFCYNWDVYEWVWKNPRPGEYDYKKYGELLNRATEIWVPSHCTAMRTNEWYGNLPGWDAGKIHRILSSAPYWESNNVRDDGYVYCSLREIPDPHWDWFECACKELNIPYKMTRHQQSFEEYQKVLAGCRLMVSHCYELSTGGLSLLEGYYLGKPCLLSDSVYHGGEDYLGDRAVYFEPTYKLFKQALKWYFMKPPVVPSDHKEWVVNNYSEKAMCTRIMERLSCRI